MRGYNYNTFLVLPLIALLLLHTPKLMIGSRKSNFLILLNTFALYVLFTGIFYFFNDVPFEGYTSSFRTFFFPIIFTYLGYGFSFNHEYNKWYLYACAFCFLVGIYLYFATPSYYIDYILKVRSETWYMQENIYKDDSVMAFVRFASFFGASYAVSYFSVPALTLALAYSINNSTIGINKNFLYLFAFLSFVAAILCQQRIAMAFAFFIPFFYGFYSLKKGKGKTLLMANIFLIILIVALWGIISSMERFQTINDLIVNRFQNMSFKDAMADRTGQYWGFDRMTNWSMVTGLGLGACQGITGSFGLKVVNDGEFVKLFYEFGVIGTILFALIIITTLKRGIKNFKHYHAEVLIMVYYLAAGLGSNSLTFFVYTLMFWYAAGRIWNYDYLEKSSLES